MLTKSLDFRRDLFLEPGSTCFTTVVFAFWKKLHPQIPLYPLVFEGFKDPATQKWSEIPENHYKIHDFLRSQLSIFSHSGIASCVQCLCLVISLEQSCLIDDPSTKDCWKSRLSWPFHIVSKFWPSGVKDHYSHRMFNSTISPPPYFGNLSSCHCALIE